MAGRHQTAFQYTFSSIYRPMKMSYLPAYAPPEAIKEILHSESQRKPGANSGVTLSAEAQKKKNFIL